MNGGKNARSYIYNPMFGTVGYVAGVSLTRLISPVSTEYVLQLPMNGVTLDLPPTIFSPETRVSRGVSLNNFIGY